MLTASRNVAMKPNACKGQQERCLIIKTLHVGHLSSIEGTAVSPQAGYWVQV